MSDVLNLVLWCLTEDQTDETKDTAVEIWTSGICSRFQPVLTLEGEPEPALESFLEKADSPFLRAGIAATAFQSRALLDFAIVLLAGFFGVCGCDLVRAERDRFWWLLAFGQNLVRPVNRFGGTVRVHKRCAQASL
jgi:hypothetical protein